MRKEAALPVRLQSAEKEGMERFILNLVFRHTPLFAFQYMHSASTTPATKARSFFR